MKWLIIFAALLLFSCAGKASWYNAGYQQGYFDGFRDGEMVKDTTNSK